MVKVNRVDMKNEFKICPVCGYGDGFHSMFEKLSGVEEISWKLICPDCHNVFDIGLKTKRE
jgi:rRNA maturation endonuclease Nob1